MKRFILFILAVFITNSASLVNPSPFEIPPGNMHDADLTQRQQKLPMGKSTRYGLFKQRTKGTVVNDPASNTGKVIRGSILEFTGDNTEHIPLYKGIRFGYRYWLKFPIDQNRPGLKRVLIHPEMTLPDGSIVSRSERTINKRATHGIVTAIDAYTLSEDYELVEGEWIFQLWHNDHKLVEQTFITFIPG